MLSGLNVVEVAHDFQQQIRRYIVEDLKLLNSYDTWHGKCSFQTVHVHQSRYIHVLLHVHQNITHLLPAPISCYTGTKNVAKTLAKIVKGRRGDPIRDQLADKSEDIH